MFFLVLIGVVLLTVGCWQGVNGLELALAQATGIHGAQSAGAHRGRHGEDLAAISSLA